MRIAEFDSAEIEEDLTANEARYTRRQPLTIDERKSPKNRDGWDIFERKKKKEKNIDNPEEEEVEEKEEVHTIASESEKIKKDVGERSDIEKMFDAYNQGVPGAKEKLVAYLVGDSGNAGITEIMKKRAQGQRVNEKYLREGWRLVDEERDRRKELRKSGEFVEEF